MANFTTSGSKPVNVSIHPPVVFRGIGPQAGKVGGGGAWRGVRTTLTGPNPYSVGGSALPPTALRGLKRIEAVLVLANDEAVANADGNQLRFVSTTEAASKIQVFTNANVEAGAIDLSASSWEVLILGR
jgi:hypothetical protein